MKSLRGHLDLPSQRTDITINFAELRVAERGGLVVAIGTALKAVR